MSTMKSFIISGLVLIIASCGNDGEDSQVSSLSSNRERPLNLEQQINHHLAKSITMLMERGSYTVDANSVALHRSKGFLGQYATITSAVRPGGKWLYYVSYQTERDGICYDGFVYAVKTTANACVASDCAHELRQPYAKKFIDPNSRGGYLVLHLYKSTQQPTTWVTPNLTEIACN